jgi:hypothetical protein
MKSFGEQRTERKLSAARVMDASSACQFGNRMMKRAARTGRIRADRRMSFSAAFVAFSFFGKEQPDNTYVLVEADGLVRSEGSPPSAK